MKTDYNAVARKVCRRIMKYWTVDDKPIFGTDDFIEQEIAKALTEHTKKLEAALTISQNALRKIQNGMGPDKGADEQDWDGLGNSDLREAVAERVYIARSALAKIDTILVKESTNE